jgi:hypothetical protein
MPRINQNTTMEDYFYTHDTARPNSADARLMVFGVAVILFGIGVCIYGCVRTCRGRG